MNTIAIVGKYACYVCYAVCAIFTNIATKFVSLKSTHMKKSLFFCCGALLCASSLKLTFTFFSPQQRM